MRFTAIMAFIFYVVVLSAACTSEEGQGDSRSLTPEGQADSRYLTPPSNAVELLDAPHAQEPVVSPSRHVMALLDRDSMPPIRVLSEPMLRLAGFRINPKTNGSSFSYRAPDVLRITLKNIADGSEVKVATTPNARLGAVAFSPDGTRLAFTKTQENGIELWVADVSSGQSEVFTKPLLNATWGPPCEWLGDGTALLCRFIDENRGPAPHAPRVPMAPNVQENIGKSAPARTYQDLLTHPHDEALFEYYFTSQLAFVSSQTGEVTLVGEPGLIEDCFPSPDSQFILVARVKRPFSRLVPAQEFPKEVEIWNRQGEVVRRIADLPLAETISIGGVRTGPRSYRWNPTQPATLVWAEALDEGDPRRTVPHRDRLVRLEAPFGGEPAELMKTEYRFRDILWTDQGAALTSEYDRSTRWTRTWILDGVGSPRKLWDRNAEDRYSDPGSPMTTPSGGSPRRGGANLGAILQHGENIFLAGQGASPAGDRPFVDRLNLQTLETERIFQCDDQSYETVVTLLTDDGRSLLTSHETERTPPNYFVVDTATGSRQALTRFENPYPQLAGVERQLLTYDRKDGLKLSAIVYLPPKWEDNAPLPFIVWAYPREFTSPGAAGQISGSTHRFNEINFGNMHFLFLTQGYGLVVPTMPIVGPGETANDTYVEQLVANAQAAVDAVVAMGAADRDRVGIAGHSYGAFMTANVLAHSDIFRAGMAWSGAYNRSLTPFGFQNERRTLWDVTDVYVRMSPFFHANKVNAPILLIHGEIDANSGTFPIQSKRFNMALKGHGKTVRYVTLPFEAHRYAARETLLHVAAEGLNWFDKYVKNAAPQPTSTTLSDP